MFEELEPFQPDYNLAITKNLVDNNKLSQEYYNLQIKYATLLNKYLYQKLSLDRLDKLLEDQNYFEEMNKDYYQKLSCSKYFYLRNTVYIEHLTREQLDILRSLSFELTEETIMLLENTYKDVITTYNTKSESIFIPYGILSPEFFKPNDCLVLGFRIQEENYDSDEEEMLKNEYIDKILSQLETDASNVLGIDTYLIEYNDYSVILADTEKGITI